MLRKVPEEALRIGCTIEEYQIFKSAENRKLYLTRPIYSVENEELANDQLSAIAQVVQCIIEINEQDKGLDAKDRRPIRLFVNSPGGDISEGFPLVAAIELSKTPVHTINIGEWSSMAFWIGIAGHKRFALPYTKFLLHEGSTFAGGTSGAVQDVMDFEKRYKDEIIKKHVLSHSSMTEQEYTALLRCEYYMLPEDALRHGFIDEIIADIDTIL